MVFVLHKFQHYNLLGNKRVFYVDHMVLVYLVNKPHVSRNITRWFLLFLTYDFKVVYIPNKKHVVENVWFKLPNTQEHVGVLNQIIDASLFVL
jgi:hypothetical protein